MISTRTLNPWLRRGQKRDTPCPEPVLGVDISLDILRHTICNVAITREGVMEK
jgi:hypothetical protein